MKDLSKGTILLEGGVDKGLYQLPSSSCISWNPKSWPELVKHSGSLLNRQFVHCNSITVDSTLWYHKLGYPRYIVVHKILSKNNMIVNHNSVP